MSQRLELGGLLTKKDVIKAIRERTKNCCHSCLNLRKYEYPEIFMLTKDGKLRYIWRRHWERGLHRIWIMHTDYRCAKGHFEIQHRLGFIYRNCPDYVPDKDIIGRLNKWLQHEEKEKRR